MTDLLFKYIRQTRSVFTQLVDGLDLEAINTVPDGFRNNIGWNFGHIVVSTQALCYLRTQVQPERQIPFIKFYGKGSRPEQWIDSAEITLLKTQLEETIDEIQNDYKSRVFTHITPFATSTYGLEMDTIEQVITATLAHDNLHLGYAMAIRRALEGNKK